MATHIKINPLYIGNAMFPYRRFLGGPGSKDTVYVEAATQTYKSGDLIFMNDASDMTICAESGGNVLTGPIGGQAIENASGTTGKKVFFAVIRPHDRFICNVFHGTQASAITAETQIGDVFGLRHNASRWQVDIENAVEGAGDANAVVKVVGFPLWHPLLNVSVAIGDVFGLVECEFLEFSAANDFAPFTRRLQFA